MCTKEDGHVQGKEDEGCLGVQREKLGKHREKKEPKWEEKEKQQCRTGSYLQRKTEGVDRGVWVERMGAQRGLSRAGQ